MVTDNYQGRMSLVESFGGEQVHVSHNSLASMSFAEHVSHEGIVFQALTKVTTVGLNAVHSMILNVPAIGVDHSNLWMSGASPLGMILELYEDVTTQAPNNDGSAITEHNILRSSDNTADIVATHTPTINASGILLDVYQTGEKRDAGTIPITYWLIKPSTIYRLKGISLASNNDMTITVRWSEE